MPPKANVWLGPLGWFGPSYPEAGDPPVSGEPAEPLVEAGPVAVDDGPPPRAGRGSGQPVWLAYALAHGVDVHPDTDRNDIIDACRDAGVRID